ncbi:MAG: complex I subunit 1 family protein [Lentisphaerota bacterium]
MNWLNVMIIVGGTLAVGLFGILAGLFYSGVDRVLVARMQARIGPPVRQPFIDMLKLLTKENVVPDNAIPWLFNAAPMVCLASAVSILLYIPMGPISPIFNGYGDLVLIMYLLILPALAMVTGGFASGSPYATIGAQREMVTMIAYELPLASTVIAFAWKLSQAGVDSPFSLLAIAQHPLWSLVGPVGAVGVFLLLIAMLFVTPGELGRIPFDAPEAETELAGGLLVEYSGRNLALFYLALAVKTIIMSALCVALFFPYNITTWLCAGPVFGFLLDALFFLFKMLVVMFFAVSLMRVAVARFRITQVMDVYWKYVGGLALLGLILIMMDAWIV